MSNTDVIQRLSEVCAILRQADMELWSGELEYNEVERRRMLEEDPSLTEEDLPHPEAPPDYVRAGSMGRVLAQRAREIPVHERKQVFKILEHYLTYGDNEQRNFVAVGVLESVLFALGRGEVDLQSLWSELGPEVRAVLRRLQGPPQPGWMT